jgi:hypothetical protein
VQYLWTGDITPELYDLFCTFTDPTLSFVARPYTLNPEP